MILVFLALACTAAPAAAAVQNAANDYFGITGLSTFGDAAAAGVQNASADRSAGPQVVSIGTYVVDFTSYNARDGTFEANFYVTLSSDRPVNTTDFEMMNGHADKIGLLIDTPNKKYFRVFGSLDADPDFHRYPFDRHTLPIIVETRIRDASELILVIDKNTTGLDSLASLPGWELNENPAYIMNHTYEGEVVPYSRAVFSYNAHRDTLSTFLKFFLPIMLIIIVSLSSLLMRVTPRLGLNASMFLAAVLIHWRVADAVPLVAYVTFLDYFMIVTYATLFMVLISGILIIRFSEMKNQARIDQVNYWAIRIIPAVSITLYVLLFLTLLR